MLWPYFLSEKIFTLTKSFSSYKNNIFKWRFQIFLRDGTVWYLPRFRCFFRCCFNKNRQYWGLLLLLCYMQNILKFKVGFTLSSFQKEFSFEEKDEGINKELDVSLLANTPKGKYKIHQHLRCVVLYHGYYILVKYLTLTKPAGRSSAT